MSVVIPTLDGSRGGGLPRLLEQVRRQNFAGAEIFLIRGDPRQGRAINVGAALARGEYLLTLDDDTRLPDPDTFGKLVHVMERHPDIGAAGGNNLIPPAAPFFIRRAMREIPRRSWPMVEAITDSDLAEHPCLMLRAHVFRSIGGENELIPRGLDPYLRREIRRAGLRVVVVPGVAYHHLPPPNLRLLLKQFYRNGSAAAFVNRNYPEWVIETPHTHGHFVERMRPARRVLRFGLRLAQTLARGHLIGLAGEISYAAGFLSHCFQPPKSA